MLEPLPRPVEDFMRLLANEHSGEEQQGKRFKQHKAEQQLKPNRSRPYSEFQRRNPPLFPILSEFTLWLWNLRPGFACWPNPERFAARETGHSQ